MEAQRLIIGIGLAILLSGCPLLDKEDEGGGGPSGPPGGGLPVFPEEVVEGDGLEPAPDGVLVEALYNAAASCGWQNANTVPGGWQPILVSNDGCTEWIPTDWTIMGQADNAGFSPDASRRFYAYTLVNPLPTGYEWTADQVIDFMIDSIAVEFQEDRPSILWRRVTAVDGLELADAAYAFFLKGEPMIGSVRVHFGGCDGGACHALIMGYWLPIDGLEVGICALTQIDQSLQCPGLGVCVEPICASWCIHAGANTGGCDGGSCVCP
jgi:hypothetical protein